MLLSLLSSNNKDKIQEKARHKKTVPAKIKKIVSNKFSLFKINVYESDQLAIKGAENVNQSVKLVKPIMSVKDIKATISTIVEALYTKM